MEAYVNPKINEWATLSKRPILPKVGLDELILTIFNAIQKEGDEAVKKYTLNFDEVRLSGNRIAAEELRRAGDVISLSLQKAIILAKDNIGKFHAAQMDKAEVVETTVGVKCWRERRAIETVGIYVPGGTAPLFSTVLMLGIPAMLAGCKQVVLCTPPNADGKIHPAILYCAHLIGIKQVFAVGGIQAIGAMTFGTATIPKVDKLFGPGNQYVTAAKQAALNYGVAIDMPAGPSEVLVVADRGCVPAFVAADLLSQAEHGPDSQVILLSDSDEVIRQVRKELENQLEWLPRKDVAGKALDNSKVILLSTIATCIAFSNQYAPEHLILAIENAERWTTEVTNAGSVFLGNYSCESAGDYASGTNHTLPTNGYARNYSGVSVDSFVKQITFQELSAEGIRNIGPAIELMAEAEELLAHKNAVTLRLKTL
jgi:histidinol dehydrogenase